IVISGHATVHDIVGNVWEWTESWYGGEQGPGRCCSAASTSDGRLVAAGRLARVALVAIRFTTGCAAGEGSGMGAWSCSGTASAAAGRGVRNEGARKGSVDPGGSPNFASSSSNPSAACPAALRVLLKRGAAAA